jgi:hypothetical protein
MDFSRAYRTRKLEQTARSDRGKPLEFKGTDSVVRRDDGELSDWAIAHEQKILAKQQEVEAELRRLGMEKGQQHL